VEYAACLVASFETSLDLKVCFFTCTGSEANDLAIRIARAATGEWFIILIDMNVLLLVLLLLLVVLVLLLLLLLLLLVLLLLLLLVVVVFLLFVFFFS
jgi:hypothetical protein